MKNKSYDKKLFRYVYILNKLDGKAPIRTSELAETFSVTLRTVQRDMEYLDMAGFPMINDRDGYKLTEGTSLRKIIINSDEKFLLGLFYKIFAHAGQPYQKVVKGFLNKILTSSSQSDDAPSLDKNSAEAKELRNKVESLIKSFGHRPFKQLSNVQKQKLNAFIDQTKARIEKLRRKEGIDIKFEMVGRLTTQDIVFALIGIPYSYFEKQNTKTPFRPIQKLAAFSLWCYSSPKSKNSLDVTLWHKHWFGERDPHNASVTESIFDKFAGYLGFNDKDFTRQVVVKGKRPGEETEKVEWRLTL